MSDGKIIGGGAFPGDTEIGGQNRAYPSTLWTAVLHARERKGSEFSDHLGRLIERYWKPVFWTLRTRWRRPTEEAKDLTQAFFASFLEQDRLQKVGPEKGRFRTYLRAVLDNYMKNEVGAAQAMKRGGGWKRIGFEGVDQKNPLEAVQGSPEELFDRAWAMHLFDGTAEELKRRYTTTNREIYYQVFERHELEARAPSSRELASEYGISPHSVENYLKHARNSFKEILRERVRETLSDESHLEDELRCLAECMG